MLIREAAAQGNAILRNAGIDNPGLDSSLILSFVLKTSRTSLMAAGSESISEKDFEAFLALIEKRRSGFCAAYITGKKEFRGLEFAVNSSVLVPRPDTETLVEAALKTLNIDLRGLNGLAQNKKINVLDLCTGSGAVAIALKHEMPELEVHASDICAQALDVAQKNSECLLGIDQINFFISDLFDVIKSKHSTFLIPHSPASHSSLVPYSLITANPPYVRTDEIKTLSAEVQNEPRIALDGGESGLFIIECIINEAPQFLINGGSLLLEADPRQMEAITILLKTRRFINIKIYNDLGGSQRVIGGKFEK